MAGSRRHSRGPWQMAMASMLATATQTSSTTRATASGTHKQITIGQNNILSMGRSLRSSRLHGCGGALWRVVVGAICGDIDRSCSSSPCPDNVGEERWCGAGCRVGEARMPGGSSWSYSLPGLFQIGHLRQWGTIAELSRETFLHRPIAPALSASQESCLTALGFSESALEPNGPEPD